MAINKLRDQEERGERGPDRESGPGEGGHPNRQGAISFRTNRVRNNADPGPWSGLLRKVVGNPKTPRVR